MKKQAGIFLIVMISITIPKLNMAQSKKEITHIATCETSDIHRDNLAKSIAGNIMFWMHQGRYDTATSFIQDNQKDPRDPGSVGCKRVARKLNALPGNEALQIKTLSDSSKNYYLYREKNRSTYWVLIQHR